MSEQELSNECVRELQYKNSPSDPTTSEFESPLITAGSMNGSGRKMNVSQELKEFNTKLQGDMWSQQIGEGATIGLALISSRNVMQAMRETLSLLYNDFCSSKTHETSQYLCQPLVDILGVLSHSQVEATSLSCLLQPYIAFTTTKWVDRPLSDQSDIYLEGAGMQLLQALPPVPLALAFVTILLEQKVCT